MAEPKVYGMIVQAPLSWPVETQANGSRQIRVIAAVRSRAAFFELLDAAKVNVSRNWVNQEAMTTGNDAELAVAGAAPGVLFHATRDYSREYLPVPEAGR